MNQWKHLQPMKLEEGLPSEAIGLSVAKPPWEFLPHLHPRLKDDERHTVDPKDNRGSLFLENSVQLDPDACLIYLSNTVIDPGCYRFGGEGHLVDLRCEPLTQELKDILHQELGQSFALITPAVWGSNRLSLPAPSLSTASENGDRTLFWGDIAVSALFTQRPQPVRYRLGQYKEDLPEGSPRILSRGRYATPAGTVYVLEQPLAQTWKEQTDLFPSEGVSLQRWGYGLSLPLDCLIQDE